MSDWKEYKLRDLVTFSQGIQVPVEEQSNVRHSNMGRFVRIVDFTNPDEEPRFIKIKDSKYWVNKKDVVMIRYGSATAGKVVRGLEGYIANNMFKVIPNKSILNEEFLYYFLSQSSIYSYLMNSQSSSTMPAIKFSDFDNIKIKLPSLDIQKHIVLKLNRLNDKIELNTQINQTLEQIVQSLFKSWFVDFDPVRAKVQALSDGLSLEQAELAAMQTISGKTPEKLTALSQTQPDRYAELAETAKAFPCEMVEVDGGEMPKGWEYKLADELFDIGIGKTPPRKETEWFSTNPDDMQWISIKDMGNSGVFITESSEFLTNQAVDKFNIRKIPENTVLLSFKLTIGRVSITTCETTTNEAIAHFKITDKSFLTTEYLYLFFQQFDFNSLGSTSSIATAVNSKTIKGIEILIPNEELIKAFQMKISNIFAQIKNLTMENKNLVETRDLLLPKLLNWGIL
jgi:putative type-1 restriction enzyme hindVIIP specificity protein